MFKKFKILSKIFFLTLLFALTTSSVFAVEENKPVQLVSVAHVNIYEATIVSQNKNNIKLSFNLSNGQELQTGIKYGVNLVKETEKGQYLVDQKVYEEVMFLAENSDNIREITYVAPSTLEGEYTIFINAKNESGKTFGVAYAGKINLESSHQGVIILPETCYLTISGNQIDTKYNLVQGVDIGMEEILKLNCMVSNTSSSAVKASPLFETYYRNLFGKIVEHTGVIIEEIDFGPNEEKEVSIALPKATEPQAYDVKVTLKGGNELSNSIIVHYVLQGVSATIQSLSLDKDYYRIGEKAIMTFSFTPSADSYPGSRQGRKTKVSDITLSASLKDGRGNLCAEQVEKVYESGYSGARTELQVGIKSNCKDPIVTLSLTDQTGKLLDEKTFAIETQSKDKSSEKALIIFGIVILILLIFYVVAGVVSKKKKDEVNLSSFIFLLIFSTIFISGMLFSTSKAEAMESSATMLIDDLQTGGGGGTPEPVEVSFVVNLDKGTYGPNDQITVTSTISYEVCSNASRNFKITGYVDDDLDVVKTLYDYTLQGGNSKDQVNKELSAPSKAGDYKIKGTLNAYYLQYSAKKYDGLYLVENKPLYDFKQALVSYAYTYLDLDEYENFSNALSPTYSLSEVQTVIDDYVIFNEVEITESATTNIAMTANFELPFTVVAPTTAEVNVTIRDESGEYVEGPVTKSVGQNVLIKWTTNENATSCECTCRDPNNPDDATNEINCGNNEPFTSSCGSGTGIQTPTIYNVVRNIKFEVKCSP